MKTLYFSPLILLTPLAALTLAGCELASAPVPVAEAAPRAAEKSVFVALAKTGDTFEVALQKEVAKAKAAKLHPYIEFTADWCPPCNAFKKYLHDPSMQDALEGTYIIAVNFDDWSTAAEKLGVRGIPTWIALDESGAPTARRINSSVWGDDIPSNMAPPLKKFFRER